MYLGATIHVPLSPSFSFRIFLSFVRYLLRRVALQVRSFARWLPSYECKQTSQAVYHCKNTTVLLELAGTAERNIPAVGIAC